MNKGVPEDLEVQIFLRLPVKSLLQFKSVCKRWQNLISTPSFIISYNHHECRRRDNLLFCYGKGPFNTRARLGIVVDDDHRSSKSITTSLQFPPFYNDDSWAWEDLADENFIPEFKQWKIDIPGFYKHRYDIHIIGPINGIYCIYQRLRYKLGGTIILWNPATRSYKYCLPHVSFPYPIDLEHCLSDYHVGDAEVSEAIGLHIGFGYDNTINDYKFVVIYNWINTYNPMEHLLIKVYNNGTNSWSTIYYDYTDDCTIPYVNSEPRFCNSFVNGACHFSCAKKAPRPQSIDHLVEFGVFAVDMVKHTFKYMRGPPIPFDSKYIMKRFTPFTEQIKTSVWRLRDTIAMVASYNKYRKVEVWIMTEYGVEDSWNLLCTIPIRGGFDLVGIPNDERIFVGNRKGQLISYGFDNYEEDHGVKTKPLGPYRGNLGVLNYVESLASIPLKEVL